MPIPKSAINAIEKYFDKVFVLSVPRFIERHEQVKHRLDGLSFEFFWGADKQQLNLDQAKLDGTYDELLAVNKERQGKALSIGELACSLTHRKLYQAMVDNKWNRVLVFEDDILPLEHELNELPQTLHELPENWDLVYLGYLKHEEVTNKLKRKQYFYKFLSKLGLMKWTYTMVGNLLPKHYSTHLRIAGFHDCTHAYALTISCANKLLKEQTPVIYRADDLLSYSIIKGKIKAFITRPKFFDQEHFHSNQFESTVKQG